MSSTAGSDGRWIAEALELPGIMTYGATRDLTAWDYEFAFHDGDELAQKFSLVWRSTHSSVPPLAS